MCNEAYNGDTNSEKEYLYSSEIGDYKLISNKIAEMNLLVYKSINQAVPTYIFSIKGTSTLYDLAIDFDILKNYSEVDDNSIENYMNLYDTLLNLLYEEIITYYGNGIGSQFILTGHSLGGKLCLDLFNKLITNEKTNFVIQIFNPFSIYDSYTDVLLENLDKGLLNEEGYENYTALKNNVFVYIVDGDYASLVYKHHMCGYITIYPQKENILTSLIGVSYLNYIINDNHTITNFINIDEDNYILHPIVMEYVIQNESDGSTSIIDVNNSYSRIYNKKLVDTQHGNHHLVLKSISDISDSFSIITERPEIYSGLYADDLTASQFYWKFEVVENEYKSYFEEYLNVDGVSYTKKYITPIYNIINKEYSSQIYRVYFHYRHLYLLENQIQGEYYHIMMLNPSNNNIISSDTSSTGTSGPILTQQQGIISADIEYETNSKLQLHRKALGNFLNTSFGDAIERRLFSFNFVSQIQANEEVDWNEDGLRRLINTSDINIYHNLQQNNNTLFVIKSGASTISDRYLEVIANGSYHTGDVGMVFQNSQASEASPSGVQWTIEYNSSNNTYTIKNYSHPEIIVGNDNIAKRISTWSDGNYQGQGTLSSYWVYNGIIDTTLTLEAVPNKIDTYYIKTYNNYNTVSGIRRPELILNVCNFGGMDPTNEFNFSDIYGTQDQVAWFNMHGDEYEEFPWYLHTDFDEFVIRPWNSVIDPPLDSSFITVNSSDP